MECGNPEIFNFCISSTKVFISYTFQMLHLLQVKRFEQNIPISYIKFFYSLWEITNKDNILRGTVPWTFLEGCRHLTPLPLVWSDYTPTCVPYYIMNAWRKQTKFYSSIFCHFGDNMNSIVHENVFANFY